MDELSINAGIQYKKRNKNVGYICCNPLNRIFSNFQSEGQKGFSEFHVYVCASLLDKYNSQILDMDFQVRSITFLGLIPRRL